MSAANSKQRVPLVIHFVGEQRERLRRLAKAQHRSVSNMAGILLRDGMDKLEQQSARSEQTGA